jgi:hypothetical protein
MAIEDQVESGRLVLYINGEKPVFYRKCSLKAKLIRLASLSSLFIGALPVAQEKLGNDAGGITVVAGWNLQKEDEFEDFLYLRGQ